MSRETDATAAVRNRLQSYADRGVFRAFVQRPESRGLTEFRFLWLLEKPLVLLFDPTSLILTFLDLLPNVGYPSEMDRSFRAFLRDRSSSTLPSHRRIDPARVTVSCRSRHGNLSVTLKAQKGQCSYATRKAVSLVNEVFHGFLLGPYHEYMVENFNQPEE